MKMFNPLSWNRWAAQFLHDWFFSLPMRRVAVAAPSLIAAWVLLAIAGLSLVQDSNWREQQVRRKLHMAIASGAYAEAEILADRLLHLHPDQAPVSYQWAIAALHGANKDAAIATLQRLACEQRYAPAAVWLLSHAYQQVRWESWDASKREEYGVLLEVAATGAPGDRAICGRYADYLLETGEAQKALPLLVRLAPFDPGKALYAAAVYRQLHQESQAEAIALQGLQQLNVLATREPERIELKLAKAQALAFLHRYQECADLLMRARQDSNDVRLSQGAAEALVLWSRELAARPDQSKQFSQRMSLLNEAIRLSPKSPAVLSEVIGVVLRCLDAKDPHVAEVRDLLVNGVAPEFAHFIRGTSALLRGDQEEAELHLQLAVHEMPNAPAILNNLAVALASQADPDLERALALVNGAIERSPGHPYFHETRGQIYLKMDHPRLAIPDLETALKADELASIAHTSLADAYGQLGRSELAEEHRRFGLKAAEPTEHPAGTD